MIAILNTLRGTGVLATILKIFFAVFCGACIGIEREYKQRAAGFRTHILISLGAAMTMVTSQFLVTDLGLPADPGRLGAQVVAGIGFIGAGSIIVSRRNRVTGLTTAAGLWATAIIGLCAGIGYYEGSLIVTFLILFAEVGLSKIEHWLHQKDGDVGIYVEYSGMGYIVSAIDLFKQRSVRMLDIEIIKDSNKKENKKIVLFTVRMNKNSKSINEVVKGLKEIPHTIAVKVI